jgi:hypothetical protein
MSDKLSKAKQVAGDTWSGLASAVSTQWQIRKLQKEIAEFVEERDRLMMEIGHKVYALHGRGKVKNADLLELCRRIEGLGSSVDALNERIRNLSEPAPKGELEETEVEDETSLEEAEEPAEEPSTAPPPPPEEPDSPGENTPATSPPADEA